MADTLAITGSIKVIGTTETVGNNGFTKRLLVVTTAGDYPQDIALDFVKDKVDILDNFEVGQEVTVSFNLRGNEYKGRYYISAQAWKIEGGKAAAKPAPTAKPATAGAKPAAKAAPAKPAAKAAAPAEDGEDAPW